MIGQEQEARAADLRSRSVPELAKHIAELVPQLVRAELALAKAELTEKGRHAGVGAGLLGGGGGFAFFGLGALVAAAALGLAEVLPGWAAALIVGGALLATAGLLALVAGSQMRRAAPLMPEQAIASTRLDIEAVKESARR